MAVDVNEGRLRMLTEAAKVQGVSDIVISCHYDLRDYAVCVYYIFSKFVFCIEDASEVFQVELNSGLAASEYTRFVSSPWNAVDVIQAFWAILNDLESMFMSYKLPFDKHLQFLT